MDKTPIKMTDDIRLYAYMIPVFAVAAFGVSILHLTLVYCWKNELFSKKFYFFKIVSVLIITYRVATFNNCDEAYRELVSEIEEAKADLAKKGFKRE